MIALTYDTVDQFVSEQVRMKNDIRWDGWTMVVFNRDPRARKNKNGRYRLGQWGFETRISANRDGLWMIKPTLVRGAKRGRR